MSKHSNHNGVVDSRDINGTRITNDIQVIKAVKGSNNTQGIKVVKGTNDNKDNDCIITYNTYICITLERKLLT